MVCTLLIIVVVEVGVEVSLKGESRQISNISQYYIHENNSWSSTTAGCDG
jgi:hypothetical protein